MRTSINLEETDIKNMLDQVINHPNKEDIVMILTSLVCDSSLGVEWFTKCFIGTKLPEVYPNGTIVKINITEMDYETDNYRLDPDNNEIVGWDEIRSWKIEIINTRTLPITIEVTRDFGTNFWTFESLTPYEKYDMTKIRFNLNIEPRTKHEIEYAVTTYHGTRQDEYDQ